MYVGDERDDARRVARDSSTQFAAHAARRRISNGARSECSAPNAAGHDRGLVRGVERRRRVRSAQPARARGRARARDRVDRHRRGARTRPSPQLHEARAAARAAMIDRRRGDHPVHVGHDRSAEGGAAAPRHDPELLDGVIGTLRGGQPGERARMPNLVPVSLSLWAGIYQVLFAFTLGVPVVLMEQFSPPEFARLVREHGIRSSVLPPAAMVMLLQDPAVTSLEPLRYVRSVSAPLSPTHARAFHERFGVGILNGYGQTELGGEVVGWSAADWKEFGPAKLGAVGRPHAGHRGPGARRRAPGSIRGRAAGRRGDARRSASPPTAGCAPATSARIDDDGFVWIDGRVSSMINRGGLKVFPDEVEEHLREFPGRARRRGRRRSRRSARRSAVGVPRARARRRRRRRRVARRGAASAWRRTRSRSV